MRFLSALLLAGLTLGLAACDSRFEAVDSDEAEDALPPGRTLAQAVIEGRLKNVSAANDGSAPAGLVLSSVAWSYGEPDLRYEKIYVTGAVEEALVGRRLVVSGTLSTFTSGGGAVTLRTHLKLDARSVDVLR